jgi:hypothetical protein
VHKSRRSNIDAQRQIKANRELASRARSIAGKSALNKEDRARFLAAADELEKEAEAVEHQFQHSGQ